MNFSRMLAQDPLIKKYYTSTNQAVAPQSPATDRGYVRRNALDHGAPPELGLRHVMKTKRERENAQRNAIEAVPQMSMAPVGSLMQQGPAAPTMRHRLTPLHAFRSGPMTPAMRGAPPPLPNIGLEAPSLQPGHPYAHLGLAKRGSGNRLPPPPSGMHCAECFMDMLVAHQHQKYPDQGCRPVVADNEFRAPRTGQMVVAFVYEGEQVPGVFLDDIIMFKANIAQAGQRLIRAGEAGPMRVTFHIEGLEKVQDIVYGNCAHRPITHFNLAWALATSLQHIAKQAYGTGQKDLALMSLVSDDSCTEWVALARFVYRIDC
ncbi:hypothetical protein B0H12DRAFT_1111699 [Mycena haematopus]|nr:hypothetical protein B0H12DRAFT_1111699 [Mycena haematopus]